MITTTNIKLIPNEFFKILLKVYFKKRWWYLLLLLLLSIFLLFEKSTGDFRYFFLGFSILYPLLIILQYWRYTNSTDNKIFFLEKHYDIDENQIVAHVSDGSDNTLKREHFVKVIEFKTCYLLYISKAQFVCLPKAAFKTEEDLTWF